MSRLRHLITDLSGNVLDHGCQAPVLMFQRAFQRIGVKVTTAEVRAPMGRAKLDHVRQLLSLPLVRYQWLQLHHRQPNDEDAHHIYESLAQDQETILLKHRQVIPGVIPTLEIIRRMGLGVSACSGYNREMVNILKEPMRRQGLYFDELVASDQVAEGRPAPDMIHYLMAKASVDDPALVVKIGDTPVDIEEGHSAGVWSVGVLRSSSELGLTAEEFAALSPDDRAKSYDSVRRKLLPESPHFLIAGIEDLPGVVVKINRRLARGERP